MQVRIEEQDDQDRESISLMGGTGAPDTASSSTSASTNAGGGTGMEHHGSIQDAKTLPQMISQAKALRESTLRMPQE